MKLLMEEEKIRRRGLEEKREQKIQEAERK